MSIIELVPVFLVTFGLLLLYGYFFKKNAPNANAVGQWKGLEQLEVGTEDFGPEAVRKQRRNASIVVIVIGRRSTKAMEGLKCNNHRHALKYRMRKWLYNSFLVQLWRDVPPEITTWGKIWRTVLFLGWEPFAITMDIENNSASKVWIRRGVK